MVSKARTNTVPAAVPSLFHRAFRWVAMTGAVLMVPVPVLPASVAASRFTVKRAINASTVSTAATTASARSASRSRRKRVTFDSRVPNTNTWTRGRWPARAWLKCKNMRE